MGLGSWIAGDVAPRGPRASLGDPGEADYADIRDTTDLLEYLRAGVMTSSGETIGTKESLCNSTVFRSANIIMGTIGSLPINVKNDRTKALAADTHAVQRLLRERPNSWQSPQDFKKLLTNWIIFRGNGYARKRYSGKRVSARIPMSPAQTTVRRRDNGRLEYRWTTDEGREVVLDQKDVFHVRGMSLNGYTGVSVLTYAREAIGASQAASKHGSALFKNGTRLGAVLTHPGELSEAAGDRLRDSLDKYRGADNAGKSLILEEGTEYKSLGMTSADAEFIENRKFSVTEIAMFFGVPPHMLGFTEKSTSWGSGIEQQSIGFVNYTLNDYFGMWEGAIKRDLLADEPGWIADFDTRPLLRGDTKAQSEGDAKGLQFGWVNPDEVRADRGLPPRADGKGGEYYPPPNMAKDDEKGGGDDPSKSPER